MNPTTYGPTKPTTQTYGPTLPNPVQGPTLPTQNPNPSGLTQPPVSVPSTITTSDLTNTPAPVQLPPTPTITQPSVADIVTASQGAAPTANEQSLSELQKQLLEATKNVNGKSQVQAQNEINAGLPQYNQQLNDINGQIRQLNVQSVANQERALNSGQTLSFAGGEAQRVARNDAIEQMRLSSIAQTLQGNVALAQQTADRATALQFEPEEAKIKYLQTALELNKDNLSREDKKKADLLNAQLQDRQYQVDQQKEDKKLINSYILEAAKNSAPTTLLNNALKETNPQKALALLSGFMSDPTAKAQALANLAKTRAETQKLNNDLKSQNLPVITNPDNAVYAPALSVILGSDKFTAEQKKSITNSINSGQDAFSVVKNQAKNIMGQTAATSLGKYETAKDQMQAIDSLLKDYYAQGGSTGIFSGNYEKTINKLGEVNDPKLVGIATNIAAALQIYRNAVSGTAYSVQEGKDIASIFPGITKSEGLNKAIINARVQAFDTTIDSEYRNVLGNSYDAIKKAEANKTPYGKVSNEDFYKAVPTSGASTIIGQPSTLGF